MKLIIIILLLFIFTTNTQSQIPNTQTPIDSATMYLTGTLKPYNPAKAFQIFMQQAVNGNAKAMNAVALQYAKGIGIDSNFNLAVYWFNQAISNGYKKAMVNLAMIYKHKATESLGYSIAFNLFDSAVKINEPSAFFAKGYMLYKGLGCTQSYSNALQLFKRGIDSNRADCMYFTGLCYSFGFGLVANTDSANYYIEKAAKLGYKQANIFLAYTDTTTIAARGTRILNNSKQEIVNNKTISNTDTQIQPSNNEFTNIQLTQNQIDFNGIYKGILTQYDYSGKKIIKQTNLTLNLIDNNGTILGDWIQNDTIHLPLRAVQYNNSLVFENMNIKQSNNIKVLYTRRKKENLLSFQSANFQYQKHNDRIMLVGSLQLFNNYQNEPDKPINITLLQQKINQKNKDYQNTKNSVIIYPNPINNLFNIAIETAKESNASFIIYTQDGKKVFQQNQYLKKGKQTILINASLSKGVYIIKINTIDETISRVLIKAN